MVFPPHDCAGIVSTADQSDATYLPLESLDAHIFIADVSARVILSQVYSHQGSNVLAEAFYVFPVPARAAVCSFQMQTDTGVRLQGVVKEITQAKEEYNQALSQGWLTGLLEQFRQDVFVVSIGSMPPNVKVTVILSYVVDLSEDDYSDTVRFQLSSHVRARYGAPPKSALYHGTAHSAPLNITVDVEMPGPILAVQSYNHQPLQDVLPNTNARSDPRRQQYSTRKKFSSGNMFDLQKDIVLVVHAVGVDRPRCFSEQLSRQENLSRSLDEPTTALALTIVPRFESNYTSAHECIFLIDRSGSMTGSNIRMAKRALVLLLRGLFGAHTRFNIYSFGSFYSRLWHQSKEYTDYNLAEATNHTERMDADMGGTELLSALRAIFSESNLAMQKSLLVLTDGEVYDAEGTIRCVREAVLRAPANAPIRVFTLGIGSGASTRLCQGLATAGNGSNLMTVEGEDPALKAERLVRAMQTLEVSDLTVDWGTPIQVRQAPHRIPPLSPGIRFLITAIVPSEQVPEQVTLKLRLSDGSLRDYHVKVQPLLHMLPSPFTDAWGGRMGVPPLIHTLSAHLLIQEVESGDLQQLRNVHNWDTLSHDARGDVAKRFIVELGTRYQIASAHTAFVAVAVPKTTTNRAVRKENQENSRGSQPDNSTARSAAPPDQSNSGEHDREPKSNSEAGTNSRPGGEMNSSHGGSQATPPEPPPLNSSTAPGGTDDTKDSRRSSKDGTSPRSEGKSETPVMPGHYRSPSSDIGARGFRGLFDVFAYHPPSHTGDEVFCFPNPLGGIPTIFTATPPLLTSTITLIATPWLKSLRSVVIRKPAGQRSRAYKNDSSAFSQTQYTAVPDEILSIAKLQSVDGSFAHKLLEISNVVGISETQLRNSLPPMLLGTPGSEAVWAAAIAAAFLRKRFGTSVGMWGDFAAKAARFAASMCGGDELYEQIVQEALKLF